MAIRSVVLIGAGNVGHHLGLQLKRRGLEVRQVFSRRKRRAQRLAKQVEAEAINDLECVDLAADIYILAVHDGGIEEVCRRLPMEVKSSKLVVHTSGATPSKVFQSHCKRYGVFYPLQTFSIDRALDFSIIPICTHANWKKDREALQALGQQLSDSSFEINDEQRAILHVAAVFVNNFSNHLFQIGDQITQAEGIPFSLLLPLIQETAAKVQFHAPKDMQTGPALRGDLNTLQKHLSYLERYPDLEKIYRQLSKSIQPKLPI